MDVHGGEDELWKCTKHPSLRRRTGVCFICLRERLLALCPYCAKDRPCSCPSSAHADGRPSSCSSSSCSSSSASAVSHISCPGIGLVGRMDNLIDQEPPFKRNAAFPWLPLRREMSRGRSEVRRPFCTPAPESRPPLAQVEHGEEVGRLIRSRSVGGGRGRGWYFLSPMKVFRHMKSKKKTAGGGGDRRLQVLS